MNSSQRFAKVIAVPVLLVSAMLVSAENAPGEKSGAIASGEKKEYRFKVKHHASVTIDNQYGPISVKAGNEKEVVVTALTNSDKVEIDQGKTGNRVGITSHLLPGANVNSGRVQYEVLVPADANVTLRSTSGQLHVEKLRGDIQLESSSDIDVRDLSAGHVHIKTLNGPVTLTNVRDGHVEITSVSGDVNLNAVNGPLVQVNSNTGKIRYDGDFGGGGDYNFTSHSGDIEAMAPSYASIDVTARSEQGKVENDFPLQPKHTTFLMKAGSAFAGTMGEAASSVKLFSFSGKIHLKKR